MELLPWGINMGQGMETHRGGVETQGRGQIALFGAAARPGMTEVTLQGPFCPWSRGLPLALSTG